MTSLDSPTPETCLQCGRALDESAVRTGEGGFCPACYAALRHRVEHLVRQQSEDIPWAGAAVGGVLGGAAGTLVWWGFTVATGIAFGLVAVVIGFATGWGVVRFAGGKRSRGLQFLSAGIALAAFLYATYLVNRSFFHRAADDQGMTAVLPLVPDGDLFVEVLRAGFNLFDLVFLAIALWEAWRRPAPVYPAA